MKAELNQLWQKSDDEINLFRKLSDILKKDYKVDFIEETHKHTVSFISNSINKKVNREISDLWIIMYSPSKKIGKTTFLQAKYCTRKNFLKEKIFNADYFQFELLSERPVLLSGSSFKFPKNTLMNGCCDSIGTFGVFYKDSNNQIELAYSVAKNLIPSKIPLTINDKKVKLSFPTTIDTFNISKCCKNIHELYSTFSIETFINSLINLEIGSCLQLNLIPIINHILKTKPVNNSFSKFINDNYSQFLNLENLQIDFSIIQPNILIINVDKE